MNRRNLLSRGLLAALAFAAPITPLMAQQPDLSRKAVVDDPVAPKRAGRTYDVTVVEFFDYNCPYCRRMEPVLNALLRSDPKVRVVYRDWPIFGPASREASRAAVASQWQGRHAAFHEALMTSPARLDSAGVKAAAAKAKVDWPRLQRDLKNRGAEIDALLTRTDSIAQAIGFNGTPALIVGSQVVAGAVDLPTLRRLVAEARKKTSGALTMPGPLNRRQLAGLGAVVVGGWAVGQVLRRTAPIGRDVGPTADLILAGNGSPEDGPADATLRLAVFTDYRCPACRHGFSALEEAVQRDGKVRVIYKDWPIFGPPSERAASVALACAEQGVYPTVHRALMTDSRTIDDDVLRDVVMRAGGDWLRAMTWLAAHADAVAARLRANGQEAYSIGLAGTPGYLAGPMLVMGAIDASDFQRLFARAREES